MRHSHLLSVGTTRALKKLGADLKAARLRRQLPAAALAERARTSRPTLARVEAGDPHVSIGIYASVLNSLGLLHGLGQLADLSVDPVGRKLEEARLPQRARLKNG